MYLFVTDITCPMCALRLSVSFQLLNNLTFVLPNTLEQLNSLLCAFDIFQTVNVYKDIKGNRCISEATTS